MTAQRLGEEQPPAFRSTRRGVEIARVLRRRRRLRAGGVQVLFAVVAVSLGVLMPRLQGGFTIDSNRAVEILVTVAGGTVAFIGIVFSLLFVVVQFSATTFTPRLNLFRDAPIVWRAFAFYTAVVIYSFTAALVIGRSESTSGFVPLLAFVAVVASLIVYRRLQTAAFKSIQLASTLSDIASRGREVIDGLYTDPMGQARPPGPLGRARAAGTDNNWREVRWPRPQATLQVIDVPRVLRAAERADSTVRFHIGSGETLFDGAAVAATSAKTDPDLDREILLSLTAGNERTFEQDPALPFRLLADIALRALSTAVNDPTTAVQAVDAIDGLLRALAARKLDIGEVEGEGGVIRVALVLPTWEHYLGVAFDDITSLPRLAPSVSNRIDTAFDGLASIAPPDRRPELEKYRRRLDSGRARVEASPG